MSPATTTTNRPRAAARPAAIPDSGPAPGNASPIVQTPSPDHASGRVVETRMSSLSSRRMRVVRAAIVSPPISRNDLWRPPSRVARPPSRISALRPAMGSIR
jgi:hypothetical protein